MKNILYIYLFLLNASKLKVLFWLVEDLARSDWLRPKQAPPILSHLQREQNLNPTQPNLTHSFIHSITPITQQQLDQDQHTLYYSSLQASNHVDANLRQDIDW